MTVFPTCYNIENKYFNMLNLVVKIDKGNIYELVWDNGCFTCNKDRCEKNLITKSVENENITANYENCFEIYKPDENKEPKFTA